MTTRFDRALAGWVERNSLRTLEAWSRREMGAEGVPVRLPVSAWWRCLESLDAACTRAGVRGNREVPPVVRDVGRALLGSALRWSRPDGSTLFDPPGLPGDSERGDLAWRLVAMTGDGGLETVVRRWWPGRRAVLARRVPDPPPLPALGLPRTPLAVLRPDWKRDGDLLAIDHRDPAQGTRLRLVAGGRDLLGPGWGGPTGPARASTWRTGPYADLCEWSFRRGEARVVRSALLLRGRRLALLAEQISGREPPDPLTLDIAPGVQMLRRPGSPVVSLKAGRGPRAEVVPLGLSMSAAGRLQADAGRLVLTRETPAKRAWVPLLVCWDGERNRRGLSWRPLTITERSRVCGPDEACAFRVAWGRQDSLVIYRSLAHPGPRALLGFQTSARFLVGLFSTAGRLTPLMTIV